MAGTEIVYKCTFKDYSGNDCQVQICQEGFTGATTEVDGGPSPAIIKMISEGDGKFTHIKATECEIQLVSSTSLQYLSVFLSTNKTYYVRVLRETVPLWTGWVNQEYYNEPFISPPFITNIHATDGLAELKNITLPRPGNTVLSCKQSMIYYIASILKQIMTDTNNVIWVSQDLTATTVADGAVTSRLLEHLYLDFRAFTDAEEKHINCFDALEEILTTLNARLYQYFDNWIIERIDFKKENSDYEVYDSDGVYSNTLTADWVVALTGALAPGSAIRFQNGATLEVEPSYKGYTVFQEYGNRKNLLEGLSYKLFKDYDWLDDENLRFWTKVNNIEIVREAALDAVRLKGISVSGADWLQSNTIYLENEGVEDLDKLVQAWNFGDITLILAYEVRKQYEYKRSGAGNFVSNVALVADFSGTVYRADEDVEESGFGVWTPEADLDFINYNLKDTNDWVMVMTEISAPPDDVLNIAQTSIAMRILIQKCNTNLAVGDVVDTDGLMYRNMQLYFKATKDDDYAREYSPVISDENILEPDRYDIKWGDTPAPFYGDGYGLINKHVIFDSAGGAVNQFGKGAGGSPTFNLVFTVLANDLELAYRIPRFKLRGTIIDTTYGDSTGGVDFRTILKDYDDRYYYPTGLSYNVKESTVQGEWVQMYDGSGTTGEFNDDFSDDFWT